MILEQNTISNINTFFIDSPGSNTATIQIWFNAGSSLEDKSEFGIAHFLEHMFFKGTNKYPGAALARTIESFGGEINAFTSFDYTCYYINSPSQNINESLDVLLDMVSNPNFNQEDITPEKQVVFEEYRRSIDNPNQYNFFKIQKNCFQGAYTHPILGTEKHIKMFTKEQLESFRNKFYNSSNSFLVIAGDLQKKDKILKVIEQYKLPEGPRSKHSVFKLKNKSPIDFHQKATNQITINLSIQAPHYNSNEAPLEDLAMNCLTFGDTSPLYKALISNETIANNISGSSLFFQNNGCHFMRMTLPFENAAKSISELEKSLLQIFENGFSNAEVERIRNQYVSSKIYEKESIESYAFSIGHSYAQSADINADNDFIEKMTKVTPKQVHKAMLNLFSRFLHINVQYPNNEKLPKIEAKLEAFRKKINTHAQKSLSKFTIQEFHTSSQDPKLKCVEIAKNVKFVHRHNDMTPTFVLHAYIKGGVSFENELNNGVFNLISKNITYGHNKIKYEDLKQYLETHAAYLNGFSGKNAYGLTLHGLSQDFTELSTHFMQTLKNPSFPTQYFKLEKELLKRSLHLQKEDPIKHCFKHFTKQIFNNHPYAMNLMGTEKSLPKLSRKLMMDTHNKMIKNSDLVITYCGDMDFDSCLEILQNEFDSLKARKTLKVKNPPIVKTKPVREKIFFDREQTHIMIGKPAFKISTTQDLYLKMFTTLLSGQSSELFVEVRDRQGLCYSCQPLHLTALEAGYWGIYIGSGHDKKDQAIEAILKIIDKYKNNGVSKKEFARIKKMILGQNQLNVQTNDDYASFYSIPILHDLGIDFQYETLEKINKLDHEKFNAFLSDFLKGDWSIVEVGKD